MNILPIFCIIGLTNSLKLGPIVISSILMVLLYQRDKFYISYVLIATLIIFSTITLFKVHITDFPAEIVLRVIGGSFEIIVCYSLYRVYSAYPNISETRTIKWMLLFIFLVNYFLFFSFKLAGINFGGWYIDQVGNTRFMGLSNEPGIFAFFGIIFCVYLMHHRKYLQLLLTILLIYFTGSPLFYLVFLFLVVPLRRKLPQFLPARVFLILFILFGLYQYVANEIVDFTGGRSFSTFILLSHIFTHPFGSGFMSAPVVLTNYVEVPKIDYSASDFILLLNDFGWLSVLIFVYALSRLNSRSTLHWILVSIVSLGMVRGMGYYNIEVFGVILATLHVGTFKIVENRK